jgi:hypothetical protein
LAHPTLDFSEDTSATSAQKICRELAEQLNRSVSSQILRFAIQFDLAQAAALIAPLLCLLRRRGASLEGRLCFFP